MTPRLVDECEVGLSLDPTSIAPGKDYLELIFTRTDGGGSFHVQVPASESANLLQAVTWLASRK